MDYSGCHVTLGVSVRCELYSLCSALNWSHEKRHGRLLSPLHLSFIQLTWKPVVLTTRINLVVNRVDYKVNP